MSESRHARKRPRSLRIIAGTWRGRRLVFPAGTQVRPTPDRARETLFNWLCERVDGALCLDLFAGSGILGMEALSRGAREVWFVERDRALAAAIAAHAETLNAAAQVVVDDAERFLERAAGRRFDIVFLDPPYAVPLEPYVARLPACSSPAALVYVERSARSGLPRDPLLVWQKTSRAGGVCYGLATMARADPRQDDHS